LTTPRSLLAISLLWSLSGATLAAGGRPRLENGCLVVEAAGDGRLSVTDKRTGVTWRQVELPLPGLKIENPGDGRFRPQADGPARKIRWAGRLPGIRKGDSWQPADVEFELSLDAAQPDLRLTFLPKVEGQWREIFYPWCFPATSQDACLVFPHCEGALIPLGRRHPGFLRLPKDNIYSGYGPYCACLGLVRLAAGDGLLLTFETPEAALYEMTDATIGGTPVSLPRISWRADKLRFDRPLAVTFTFSDRGGYVALAGHYRRHFQRWGFYRTLRRKAADNPAVEQMLGGGVYWLCGDAADVLAMTRSMRADGIDRAIIEIAAPYWHCPDRYPAGLAEMERAVPEIRKLGYVVSHYDQYRDAFAPDPKASSYVQMNSELYPDQIVRREDGRFRPGWPPGFVANPRASLELAARRIPADLKRFPFSGRFLDCVGTCAFWEGEDWNPRHPLDARGTCRVRQDLLRLANRCGLVVGTEGGIDCYLPWLHWLETPMSMVRWTVGSLPLPGWEPVPLAPDYRLNIATSHRIPFYSLVHHAEIVSTWRWEDGFPRTPQYWQDKNLWSVLYGGVPMYFLDRACYEKWRPRIAQTHRYVCTWVRQVAMAEMTDHRFLSADRQVQETVFSGGRGVVVNFGPQAHRLRDGQVVPGRSYRTFQGLPRSYSPPPVAETSYDDARRD
jgi:hypothetical protein